MLSFLTVIDPLHNVFCLSFEDALNLEKKLNTSIKSHEWISLGDVLFLFGSSGTVDETLYVTEEQFNFLLHLKNS